MDGRETPGGKTVRLAKQQRIKDFHFAGDSVQSNNELDTFPHNVARTDLTNEQMAARLEGRLATGD